MHDDDNDDDMIYISMYEILLIENLNFISFMHDYRMEIQLLFVHVGKVSMKW